MPALGEDVTEGVVTRWFKRAGAFVARDEPLPEASTDQVDLEIRSPVSGVVRRILVATDQVAEVGAVIAIIDTSRTRWPARKAAGFAFNDAGHIVCGCPPPFRHLR